MTYKLGSLFDGSGGFPLAGAICGIEPVWAAEVEPYPIAVTRERFPEMKHLGDIRQVNGADIEPVDIITFGSPCQDLSVAGKRAGLKHEANGDEETTRSGLFMEAVRIIKEMRKATNGMYPRFALWENVPGAFSSNKGEDFRIVCEELIKIVEPTASMPAVPQKGWNYSDSYVGDGWSLAYRVFDAQYWGVPQRRRRIHLVADFRGTSAREILFERKGVRGYFTQGRTPWQRTAGSAADCTGTASLCLNDQGGQRMDVTDGVTATLRAEAHHPPCVLESAGFCTEPSAKSRSIGYEEETSPTLRAGVVPAAVALENHPTDSRVKIAEDGKVQTLTSRMWTGGNNVPLVMKIRSNCEGGGKGPLIQTDKSATLSCNNDQTLFEPKAYGICSKDSNAMKSDNPHSGIYEAETARTLDGNGGNPSCNQGGIAVVENIPYTVKIRQGCEGGGKGPLIQENKSATLATNNDQYLFQPVAFAQNQREEVRDLGDKAGALQAEPGMKQQTFIAEPAAYDARGNGDGKTVSTITGDHENRVTDYSNVICLQGNCIDRADTAGCNGKGWTEDTRYTLNTIDRPAVAYGLDRASFNQGQNAKFDFTVDEEQQPTMTARVPGAVCCTTGSFTQATEGVAPTLMVRDWKDPTVVCTQHYIVRRLTPTECARLQGFADDWGHPEHKDDFTDEEYSFWLNVRTTQAAINGKPQKGYTKEQMLTWYNKLHTDSSEYKMWGNGIALPPALYCMQGITDVLNAKED